MAWGIGALTSLLFFGSVLLHELAHSLVARAQGTPVEGITLFIFGGAAQISDEPSTPFREFTMAIVGPVVSLVLSGFFGLVYLLWGNKELPVAALSLFLGGGKQWGAGGHQPESGACRLDSWLSPGWWAHSAGCALELSSGSWLGHQMGLSCGAGGGLLLYRRGHPSCFFWELGQRTMDRPHRLLFG